MIKLSEQHINKKERALKYVLDRINEGNSSFNIEFDGYFSFITFNNEDGYINLSKKAKSLISVYDEYTTPYTCIDYSTKRDIFILVINTINPLNCIRFVD